MTDEIDPDRFITSAEVASVPDFGDLFTGPAPGAQPGATRGPVVTQPEELQPDQLSLVPDLPTERTATALLELQALVAANLDFEESRVVQVAGAVRDTGTAGLYQILGRPGSAEETGYAVARYAGGVFGAEIFLERRPAEELYDDFAEELDRGRTA